MNRYLTIVAVFIIIIGLFLGVRYFGSIIHYACAVPEEDCPPPINLVGQFGFYVTGGELIPLWTQK